MRVAWVAFGLLAALVILEWNLGFPLCEWFLRRVESTRAWWDRLGARRERRRKMKSRASRLEEELYDFYRNTDELKEDR